MIEDHDLKFAGPAPSPYRDNETSFLAAEVNRLSDENAALRRHMLTLAEAVDKLTTWFGLVERSKTPAEVSKTFAPTVKLAKAALAELGRLL